MTARGALDAVVAHVLAQRLVAPGDRVLLALGGGTSSAGMLAAFVMGRARGMPPCELAVASVEVDRTGEGDSAEVVADVGRAARAFELPFFAVRPDVGRGEVDVRAELVALARAQGYAKVATAETRDDEVRAVLRGLGAGGGIAALRGIAPRGRAGIVRPMLALRSAEAATLARDLGIEPVLLPPEPGCRVDAFEASVLPRWRALAPGLDRSLARVAREVRALRRIVADEALDRLEAARVEAGRYLFPVEPGAEPSAVVAEEMARRLCAEVSAPVDASRTSPVRRLARLLRYPNGRLSRAKAVPTLVLPGLSAAVVTIDGVVMVRVQSSARGRGGGARG